MKKVEVPIELREALNKNLEFISIPQCQNNTLLVAERCGTVLGITDSKGEIKPLDTESVLVKYNFFRAQPTYLENNPEKEEFSPWFFLFLLIIAPPIAILYGLYFLVA